VQAKYKLYQPMDYSRIKTEQIIPSMLKAVQKNTEVKGKSYAAPFCYGTSGMVVNTKKAPYARD